MLTRIKKVIYKPILNRKQNQLVEEYSEKGLTDEILEKQIGINKKRHELDIPDESQFVFEDYVQ